MHQIRLIHWNADEAAERAKQLRSFGYEIDYLPLIPAGLRALREIPPHGVVIDLSRLPSHGRDVALGLRKYKDTRHVPLVFVGGDPQKVARVKPLLPDAVYTTWDEIENSLAHAIAHPPADPIVPKSTLAGYSGMPLPKKLGIKANSSVALFNAPDGFEETLGELPEGAVLRREPQESCNLTLWFVRSRETLEHNVEEMGKVIKDGNLWIAWPKKSSGVTTDVSESVVREAGLSAGLVDFKICAIDAIWSGLRFTRRKDRSK